MPIQQISLGARPKGEGGDTWREGSEKINANFEDLDERVALAKSVADSKTTNATDAHLLNRSNHTGTQSISTILGLQVALDSAASQIDITGNAATATKLQTACTIGGVSFNGTANINLPGVNTAGNQSTSGNAATATKLATPRKINGVSFDGTGDINLDVYNKSEVDTAIANATPTTPNATETIAGKAKIATTAIAQAGTNDTDIMTAKKVKDQVSMGGRVHARVYVSTISGVSTILGSKNILSVVRNSAGVHKITTITAMDDLNFTIVGTTSLQAVLGVGQGFILTENLNTSNQPIRTINSFEVLTLNGSTLLDAFRWGVTVVC